MAAAKAAKARPSGDQQKLVDLLRSKAPASEKALACKRLAIIGDGQAVPALAALLPDPELSSWARIALEVIPDAGADAALRTASGQLQGRLLVGVINSLGVRRDAKAIDGLVVRLDDPDRDAAAAAAVALGRIGGETAVAALRQRLTAEPAEVRSAAAEGCILCAERFLAQAKRAEAAKLYDEIRAAHLSPILILEATRGAILARGAEGVPLLVKELRSADKRHFALGLTLARELPGQEATAAIAAELDRATAQRQSLLILALADRGEASVASQIVKAAKKSPTQVRIQALHALKKIDEAASAPVLLDAALEANVAISQAALAVIDGLKGPAIDGLVAKHCLRPPAQHAWCSSNWLGGGTFPPSPQPCGTRPTIRTWQSAQAALSALGGTIQFAELSQLVDKLCTARSPEEAAVVAKALQQASQRMPDREACAQKLAAAFPSASKEVKCRLLDVFGALGGQRSLAAVTTAAHQNDEAIRDAAFRQLGQWMSVDAAPLLLELAKGVSDQKYQVRAVRAYIRLARQFVMPQSQREDMCRTAFEIAQRPDDKRLVLEILLRYPSAGMLALALDAAKVPELKDEAAMVALGIERGTGANTVDLRKALAQAGHKAVKLEILKAEYGEGPRMKDVTTILRHSAGNYRVIFLPSSSYNETFGGDPAPGEVKHLKVRYRVDGKEAEAVLSENATVVLPLPR